MNQLELNKIIAQGENSTVQFKERITDAYKVGTEMVAFSNTKGGILIIGVNDKTGKINGLSFEEIQYATNLLANTASENIKPSIVITTKTVATDKGNVLIATMKEGVDKPYKDNKGIIWIKNASDKRRVFANSELSTLMQNCGMYKPDSDSIPESSVNDLSDKAVKSFLIKRFEGKCKEHGLVETEIENYTIEQIVSIIIPGVSLEQLLQNIDLIKPTGELNLACLLLLGKRPQKYRPVFTIKCISFLGKDIAVTTFRDKIEDSEMEGNLSKQYEVAMGFLKRNLRNIQVTKEFNSLGELEIPYAALVELIVNALVHRDYAKTSPIRLFIFDDRVELISPGNLPDGLTEEQIKVGVSAPRNELLFSNAIYLLPYTGAGSGIRRALSLYPTIQLKNDELRNEFIITIPRRTTEITLGLNSVNAADAKVCIDIKKVSTNVKDVSIDVKEVSTNVKDVCIDVKDVSTNVKDVSIGVKDVSSIIELFNKHNILENAIIILKSIINKPKSRKDLLEEIGVTYQTYNKQRFIDPLIEFELVDAFNKTNFSSPKLKLEITEKGLLLLQTLDKNK